MKLRREDRLLVIRIVNSWEIFNLLEEGNTQRAKELLREALLEECGLLAQKLTEELEKEE